jgi:hypothetical protein
MPMYPHEERVGAEKRDLDDKLLRLTAFISKGTLFDVLPEEDKRLMREQRDAMMQYSEALGARISRFKDTLDSTMPLPRVAPPQLPTVGRVVLFKPSEGTELANGAEEYVALIGQVIADANNPRPYCNLLVFPPFGEPHWEGSVQEYDPDEAAATPSRSWRWPPRT